MSSCLNVKGITKTFKVGFFNKKVEVLRGVDFSVEEGEVFGFLGPNGSGKTTTIKVLLGIIYPNSGHAEIFGKDFQDVRLKNEIGFLPDSPYFYQYLTGQEFLEFYGQLFNLSYQEMQKKISQLLDMVGLVQSKKVPLRKYSRGMLQRIGLAQALINDPKLVVMDEPMEGLDPIGRKMMRDVILRLKNEGKTVFFSTHILPDAEMVCDRVAIMVKGKIEGQGLLSELLEARVRSIDLCFEVNDQVQLSGLSIDQNALEVRDKLNYLTLSDTESQKVLKELINAGVKIISITPHKESLESIFMSEVK